MWNLTYILCPSPDRLSLSARDCASIRRGSHEEGRWYSHRGGFPGGGRRRGFGEASSAEPAARPVLQREAPVRSDHAGSVLADFAELPCWRRCGNRLGRRAWRHALTESDQGPNPSGRRPPGNGTGGRCVFGLSSGAARIDEAALPHPLHLSRHRNLTNIPASCPDADGPAAGDWGPERRASCSSALVSRSRLSCFWRLPKVGRRGSCRDRLPFRAPASTGSARACRSSHPAPLRRRLRENAGLCAAAGNLGQSMSSRPPEGPGGRRLFRTFSRSLRSSRILLSGKLAAQ